MSTAASPPASEEGRPRLIVAMGVSGSGKTSVGVLLAERLAATFLEGDQFHPPANVSKMASGQPLDDSDRWPWLESLGRAMGEVPEGTVVTACSALKRAYREALVDAADEPILFVLLDGTKALIAERMAARSDHFMPPSLLASQLATLERPASDEEAMCVAIDRPVEDIVEAICREIDAAEK